MLYAKIINGVIVEERAVRDAIPVDQIKHVNGEPQLRPIEITRPSFNGATQVLEGPVDTIEPNRVTRVYTVKDKTAPELDADKVSRVNDLDMVVLKILFNHENRIRALESAPGITVNQFKNAIKGLM